MHSSRQIQNTPSRFNSFIFNIIVLVNKSIEKIVSDKRNTVQYFTVNNVHCNLNKWSSTFKKKDLYHY
jgi:hypothetical protein